MARNGMVSSGHWLASQAGLRVLMEGGNAVDAAIAVSSVLCATRPHTCGLGGDGFALIYSADEDRIHALNASGPAPMKASIDYYESKGLKKVPLTGILSITVPGLVSAWSEALSKFGTKSLSSLLRPAIEYASNGFPVYRSLASSIRKTSYSLPDSIPKVFFVNGAPPREGEVLTQLGLASTLEKIAKGGEEVFYRGEVASQISRYMKEHGGLIEEEDLAAYRAKWYPPLEGHYRGYTVYGQPPVSQGHILVELMQIMEGYDLGEMGFGSPDAVHAAVEAKKLCFQDRAMHLADPNFHQVPLEHLLSKEHTEDLRSRINMSKALPIMSDASQHGNDTTYFCVVDGHGNAVSFIQSIFFAFGSGVMVEGTGVLCTNRLSAFSLDRKKVNHLEPGKKPAHTLNTYMVFKDQRPSLVGGTPGLDDQVQTNAQVLMNILDFGMNVQEAIEAPRWSSRPGSMPGDEAKPYELWLEDRYPGDTVLELQKRGHKLKTVSGWAFGGEEVIGVDQEQGVLMGGADPRRDGYAVGW
ncbi:MAG: gamma-glutamyltransferase [Thaumarchaeota archaeon]|nr:gamma-glutamyltransferase [Nitrososphaerota archaeon]